MLILTRKLGERVTIGDDITIRVIDIKGGHVKLGIDAPKNIKVHREEVYEKIMQQNLLAARITSSDLVDAAELVVSGKKK